jgi:hypothetical protein
MGRRGLSPLVLFEKEYQIAPFELPLISFPWVKKKKKLSRTIVVPVRREELFEDGKFFVVLGVIRM